MNDKQILDLYWSRSEQAISETDKKYGNYCRYIAFQILHNNEDTEECVSDTYSSVIVFVSKRIHNKTFSE